MDKDLEAFYILKDTASGLQAYTPSEISNACNIVKSALTDKQDLERFTRLVVEKRVAMDLITNEDDVKDYIKYNSHCDKYDFIIPLTEEEFTFIKEMSVKYGKSI